MSERTLYFDSQHEFLEVLGRGNAVTNALAKSLDLKITARDNWVKLQGEDEAVIGQAERFIELLRQTRGEGMLLPKHTKLYALAGFVEGREDDVAKLFQTRVQTGRRTIHARTFGQQTYLENVLKHDLNFGIGPAGTGKTYLAMATAVDALLAERVGRIILTRPAVEAGETLGFLPGDLHQKIMPYLRPLYDALYDMLDPELIQKHMERGVIEVAPLAYMRGRTLNNSFIVLDEAQNTTPQQMMMFLTRLGYDSKCVVTGDPSQVDLPSGKPSGLYEAVTVLNRVKGIAISKLDETDVVRHELVQKIVTAYRRSRTNEPSLDDVATTTTPEDGAETKGAS